MDNKVTKKRISIHFEYDWLKYVLVILVSVFACYLLFYQINITRKHERMDIFFACYRNNSTLAADFLSTVKAEGDTVIRDVNITYGNPTDGEQYPQLMNANGFTSDLMVVTETDIKQYATWFLPFDEGVKKACIPEQMADSLEYYLGEDGTAYGVRVDNLSAFASNNPAFVFDVRKLDTSGLTEEEIASYDTKFYVAILPGSVKIGTYGKKEERHNQMQTFRFVHYFLEKYNA
jgi:hypothetical protein